MPIQFRCSGCGQPIEVDDEHAGKMAACPYCHRVVAVPHTSTFDGGPITPARPVSPGPVPEPAAPSPSSWKYGAADMRQQSALRYGRYALICVALAIVCILATVAMSWPMLTQMVRISATQPGGVSSNQLEQLQEFTRGMRNRPAFVALNYAGEILIVIALALSITSVVRRVNAPGIAALVLSGLLVLCVCVSALVTLASFGTS